MKHTLLASLLASTAAGHASAPVFEYSFPASYDGTGITITDLSGAGNRSTPFQSTLFNVSRPVVSPPYTAGRRISPDYL